MKKLTLKEALQLLAKCVSLATIMTMLFIGCPVNGNECKCPTGTTHEPGEECCTGDGCNCVVAEPAKDQSDNLTGLFDNDSSATVKGHFTNSEWAGVAGKIETALNGAFVDATGPGQKGRFRTVFGQEGGVIIIVEKTTDYNNYKTLDGNTAILYLNLDALDVIQPKLFGAITAMGNGEASMANVRDYNVPKYAKVQQRHDNHFATLSIGICYHFSIA